jgi:hypothetical protein
MHPSAALTLAVIHASRWMDALQHSSQAQEGGCCRRPVYKKIFTLDCKL